jgi:hypothetical protein
LRKTGRSAAPAVKVPSAAAVVPGAGALLAADDECKPRTCLWSMRASNALATREATSDAPDPPRPYARRAWRMRAAAKSCRAQHAVRRSEKANLQHCACTRSAAGSHTTVHQHLLQHSPAQEARWARRAMASHARGGWSGGWRLPQRRRGAWRRSRNRPAGAAGPRRQRCRHGQRSPAAHIASGRAGAEGIPVGHHTQGTKSHHAHGERAGKQEAAPRHSLTQASRLQAGSRALASPLLRPRGSHSLRTTTDNP